MTSSCVGPSASSRSRRSLRTKSVCPKALRRPDSSHSSTGWRRGQHDLLAAGRVHLLADDLADLEERPPAERQVAVDAGGELADEAGAQEELVVGRLGLSGGLTQRLAEEVSQAHAVSWIERWVQMEDRGAGVLGQGPRIEEARCPVKDAAVIGAGGL